MTAFCRIFLNIIASTLSLSFNTPSSFFFLPSFGRQSPCDITMPEPESDAQRLAARGPVPPPVPAYLPVAGSPLAVDKDVYGAIQQAPRRLVEEFTLPIRSGRAWKVPAGCIAVISTPEGPQVGMYSLLRPNTRKRTHTRIYTYTHAHPYKSSCRRCRISSYLKTCHLHLVIDSSYPCILSRSCFFWPIPLFVPLSSLPFATSISIN